MARRKRKIEKLYNLYRYYPIEEILYRDSHSVERIGEFYNTHATQIRMNIMLAILSFTLFFPVYSVIDYLIKDTRNLFFYILFCIFLTFIIDFYYSKWCDKFTMYCIIFSRASNNKKRKLKLIMFFVDVIIILLACFGIPQMSKFFAYILPIIFR